MADLTTKLAKFLASLQGREAAILYQASVTLTDAQIKALPTTGITILAAPGSGLRIVPQSALLRLVAASSTDYTNIDASAVIYIGLGTDQSVLLGQREDVSNSVTGLLAGLDGNDPSSSIMAPYFKGKATYASVSFSNRSGIYDSDQSNKALVIAATNGAAGDFTGGASGHVLQVCVTYHIYSNTAGMFI